jgi:hypothetical protein
VEAIAENLRFLDATCSSPVSPEDAGTLGEVGTFKTMFSISTARLAPSSTREYSPVICTTVPGNGTLVFFQRGRVLLKIPLDKKGQ